MNYLVLDTATSYLNIAIIKDNDVLYSFSKELGRELSKKALLEIEKAFKSVDIDPSDINKIFVSVGPGSYTGIRVGITIAKVMAYGLEKDIVPISSLKSYILNFRDFDYAVSFLDARRENVYALICDKNFKDIYAEKFVRGVYFKSKRSYFRKWKMHFLSFENSGLL